MFENMTQREKFMAMAVLGLLPVFLLFFGWMTINEKLTTKNNELNNLKKTHRDLQLQQLRGELASVRFEKYRNVSLPSATETSITQYQLWLQELGSEVGISAYSVDVKNRLGPEQIVGHNRQPVASIYRFEINRCECTLRQLTDFLYKFRQTKVLHRIKDISVTPRIEGTASNAEPNGKLAVTMTVQVICMKAAPTEREFEGQLEQELERSLDAYHDIVTRRDIFGLPNNEPRFTGKSSHEFEVGSNVYVDLNATDDDENQELTFQISEIEADLASNEDTFDASKVLLADGEVEFGRLPEGTYEFLATVTDNGWGNKTAERRITIDVVAPEPEEVITLRPEANDTKIASKVWLDNKPHIGIDVRPRGEKLELAEGDSFELDKKTWTIEKIDGKLVTINVDGQSLQFRLGSMLSDPEPQKTVSASSRR